MYDDGLREWIEWIELNAPLHRREGISLLCCCVLIGRSNNGFCPFLTYEILYTVLLLEYLGQVQFWVRSNHFWQIYTPLTWKIPIIFNFRSFSLQRVHILILNLLFSFITIISRSSLIKGTIEQFLTDLCHPIGLRKKSNNLQFLFIFLAEVAHNDMKN